MFSRPKYFPFVGRYMNTSTQSIAPVVTDIIGSMSPSTMYPMLTVESAIAKASDCILGTAAVSSNNVGMTKMLSNMPPANTNNSAISVLISILHTMWRVKLSVSVYACTKRAMLTAAVSATSTSIA